MRLIDKIFGHSTIEIRYWMARSKSGLLIAYPIKPYRQGGKWVLPERKADGKRLSYMLLPSQEYTWLKWEDEPYPCHIIVHPDETR